MEVKNLIMMRKGILFIVILLLFFAAACSSDKSKKEENNEPSEGTTSEDTASLQPTVIFEEEHSEDEYFDIWRIRSSYDAKTVLFNAESTYKRDDEHVDYIIYGEETRDLIELSPSGDLEEESCRQEFLSPNGKYIVFSCLKADLQFIIYDFEEDKIIHEEPEWEDVYALEIVGITDNKEVLLRTSYEDDLIVYSVDSKKKEEYYLSDFPETYNQLVVLDLESGDFKELISTKPYHETFMTEDILIDNVQFSPDGRYVYARIGESGSNPVYESHNFINTETGEITSFSNVEYNRFSTFDENGNILIGDTFQYYIYNVPTDTMYLVPLDVTSTADRFILSPDGKNMIYNDSDWSGNPRYEFIYKVQLDRIEDFEVVLFNGTKEDRDTLFTEYSPEKIDGELQLYPVQDDIKQILAGLWENTANYYFATKFPDEPIGINYSVNDGMYSQTIKFETTIGNLMRDEIEVRAHHYPDMPDMSCADSDLELVETKDGIDYYFYMFSNDEGELSFKRDDWCITISGQEFTEEEYFEMAYSFEKLGKVPHELSLDDVHFPTQVPIENAEFTWTGIYNRGPDEFQFNIDYNNYDSPLDLELRFAAYKKEPMNFAPDEDEKLDVSGFEIASFSSEYLELSLYDGTYYYIIELETDTGTMQSIGVENIRDMLVEVAESLE